jgi:hypothetical protein
MTTVRFVEQEDSEMVRVNFRYDPDLVELIKELSPGVRSFDRETKTWLVLDEHAVRLADVMTKAGHVVVHGDEPPPAPRPPVEAGFFGPTTIPSAVEGALAQALIDQIPPDSRGKVFRAMARILYPDLSPKGRS